MSIDDADGVLEAHLNLLLDISVKRLSKKVEISYEVTNRLDKSLYMILIAAGCSHVSLPHHKEHHEIQVRFAYETCRTCSMMSGGYYEAILQIRADGRPVTEEEEEEITAIVTELTIAAYGKDKRAFVIGSSSDKYGVDYWIGSEHLCRRIASRIETRFLATRKTNYKLVGQEKGGKDRYRITVLVRLPRFGTNDFILIDGRSCLIVSMDLGHMNCYDLIQRTRFTVTPKSVKWKTVKFLASGSVRREYMIVSHVHGQPVQLMDSKTFEMAEVEEAAFGGVIPVGETITALLLEDSGIILPLPAHDTEAAEN